MSLMGLSEESRRFRRTRTPSGLTPTITRRAGPSLTKCLLIRGRVHRVVGITAELAQGTPRFSALHPRSHSG